MQTAANARHSSASNEHYTPAPIVEAARAVLGSIDLDPASCAAANETVRATRILTQADDGMAHEWAGNVFLNPPGGKVGNRSNAVRWWSKLAAEWQAGRVSAAIFVGFSLEFLQTSQASQAAAMPLDFPCCYPRRRIAFMSERDGEIVEGDSPTHANVIVLLPQRPTSRAHAATFRRVFSTFGHVVVPTIVAT